MQEITIFSDGASRGNPGLSAIAFYIFSGDRILYKYARETGQNTNNWAEYQAAIEGLDFVIKQGLECDFITLKSDSELMVKQVNGLYKVKNNTIKIQHNQLMSRINTLRQKGIDVNIIHIDRSQNKLADSLANNALDGKI